MLDTQLPKAEDLKALSPAELTALVTRMLAHIGEQSKHIEAQDKRIDSQAQGIKWRDAKIDSITFQLAKLKAWRFGAKIERMNAQQREIFEDISERLDIVPAQFFVQRQIRGKWACKCCQLLMQEPAAPQVFDNALPTPGLQAHTVISRFVDHLPYYRQEQINARAGVYTPGSTLAAWSGHTGAQLMPLYEAHRAFVLSSRIVHADETPISLLDPGAGKTKKAYMWAYYLEPFFIQTRGTDIAISQSDGRAGQRHINPCQLNGAESDSAPRTYDSAWSPRPACSSPRAVPRSGTSSVRGEAIAASMRTRRFSTCSGSIGSGATAVSWAWRKPMN